MYMKLEDAIEIVLELAHRSILDSCDDEELEAICKEQQVACNVVEDFFVNNVFQNEDEAPMKMEEEG